jgi:glycosyltransferase involved in cell wall biosynthesis
MINDRITGCIVTYNAERWMAACLESLLRICNEIIVVDTQSTDGTREIATQRGARVISREPMGSSWKQFAANQATHDWIISIDASECVSMELSSEILRVRQYGLGQYAAYELPFAAGLRLFDRRRSTFRRVLSNERVVAFGPVGKLRGHLVRRDALPIP